MLWKVLLCPIIIVPLSLAWEERIFSFSSWTPNDEGINSFLFTGSCSSRVLFLPCLLGNDEAIYETLRER